MSPLIASARLFARMAFALAPLVLAQSAIAQTYVTLTNTNANSYTQNFDSLGTATIPNAISATTGVQTVLGSAVNAGLNGWHAAKIGGTGTAATPITANNGSFTSGGVANYGSTTAPASTNRSLGALSSGSTIPGFGALIVNETGQTLTGVQISFTAKFWRSSTSVQNVLTFGYGAVDGATVTTDNFITASGATALPAANVVGPAPVASNGPLDGNDPTNQSPVSNLTIPQALAPGQAMYIRWQDANDAGNDAGLAVDDLRLTALAGAPPATAPFVAPVTVPPLGITRTQAGANSEVTGDGGSPITARGFVFSVSSVNPSPTLGGTGVSNAPDALAQVGPMAGTLTGLTASTTYAVCSYASNAVGTTYSSVTTFTTPDAPIAFLGNYSQSFATYTGTVPTGWTAVSSSNSSAYGGDWGTGSSAGFRGVGAITGSVLGYQHTASTGTLTVSVTFVNSTGALLDALDVSYLGRAALPANTRTPDWVVSFNGAVVDTLAYSTGNTDGAGGAPADLTKSTQLTGLGIAPGAEFTITWASERGAGSGSSRQIGLADFSIGSVDPTAPTIAVNPATITSLAAVSGQPGTAQSFQVSGSNLTGNLTVTAPANFEVSTTSAAAGFGGIATVTASGALPATNVWVRIASTAPTGAVGPANVAVSGGGATTRNVAVSGTVTGSGTASIVLDPTSATNLVAFVNQPGTAQQITVTGTGLSSPIQFTAAPSDQYEVAAQGGSFGVAATLPASGGVALVRIKSGATAGSVGSAQLTFDSGSTSNTVALNGTRISGGTGGLEPGLQTFANDLNFTATGRFVWVLKSDTVIGRGTEFSGVNVGGNLGVAAGASFDVVLNGAGSSTDFSTDFWKSARSWLVFSVTGTTSGAFALGAITADSGGKAFNAYGSFALRTDVGGDVYLDWTPGSAPVGPVVTVGTTSLNLPGTTTNVAGSSTNFTVSGASLTGNITVTALDAVNFAVSTNATTGFAGSLVLTQSGGAVSLTPVYVRLTGTNAGTFSNSVAASSTGATTRTVSVTGTVTNLTAPAILVSTNALSGFSTQSGTASTSQSLAVTGTNLGGSNIAVISSNNFYEISTNAFATAGSNMLTLAPTGGVVAVRIPTNAPVTNSLAGSLALSGGGATNNVSLSGVVNGPAPVITSSNTASGTVGQAFVYSITASSSPTSFGASNLPSGLSVNSSNGLISGNPSAAGTFASIISASNAAGVGTNALSITVAKGTPVLTNAPTASPIVEGQTLAASTLSGGFPSVPGAFAWTNTSIVPPVGTNSYGVVFTPTDATNYNTVATNADIAVSSSNAPFLNVTPVSLSGFATQLGTNSAPPQTFSLSGTNLTGPVQIAAPTGFEVSTNGTNFSSNVVVSTAATSGAATTFSNSTNWVAPVGVSAVQVEAWGAGGAGGSAQRVPNSNSVPLGGGGAGGAYAKVLAFPVSAGSNYSVNVGLSASNTATNYGDRVNGGSSWFNSTNTIYAEGGQGGQTAIGNNSSNRFALGGVGTASNSIGDIVYAGGSGFPSTTNTAGGGGSSAGTATNGVAATNNVGAIAPLGGGDGGTGPTTNSLAGGSGFAPGGGGAGARGTTLQAGGAGGNGQVIVTTLSNSPVLPATTIYVRMTGAAVGAFSGDVTASSPGALTRNIAVSGVVAPPPPTVTVSTNTLPAFSTRLNVASLFQSFSAGGSYLTSNITVTAPTNFAVSFTNDGTGVTNSLTLATNASGVAVDRLVFVRMTGASAGLFSNVVTLVGGTGSNNVSVSGEVLLPVVTVSTNSLPPFVNVTNQASAVQFFNAGGSNLSTNITVTAPSGFSVAFTTNNADFGSVVTLTNTNGTATNRDVYVRMNASSATNSLGPTNINLTTLSASNYVTIRGTNVAAVSVLTANPASLTNFFTVTGTASTATNFVLAGSNLFSAVSVTAPSGFQVALTNTNSAFGNSVAPAASGGVLNTNIWVRVAASAATNTNLGGNVTATSGSTSTNVVLKANVAPVPTLSAVPTALSNFSTVVGIASTNQSFNLSASNLLGPVNLSVTNGYEISTSASNGFSTSLSVGLVSASDTASNYSTNTAITYVGSEAGTAVQNWSDPNVAKTYGTGGSQVYGTAGYYQIRPVTPTNSADQIFTNVAVGNDLGISATNYPTAASAPLFVSSIAGGAGTFVNFPAYPNFRATNGSGFVRQGGLSVAVNTGPANSPAGTNASYYGVPFEFTAASAGSFRLGLVVDSVADAAFSPNYVSLYSSNTGTLFSGALVRDGTPDIVFFDVTATAGDTFVVGLWQNTGTQSVAALSMVTFDALPGRPAGWTNGANGGTGFGPWAINVNSGTGFAGVFIGNPSTAGIATDGTFGTNAFGMYANPGGSGAFAVADRDFAALRVGQTFTFQWAVNFDADAGNKGFNLYAGGTGGTQLINANQAGFPGSITFNGTNAITNYGTNAMTWAFTMTSSNNLLVTSTARDGTTNIAFTTNLTVTAPPDSLRWYASGMGAGDQRQPYFNNLQIAYAGGNISNLPVYVRIATNAPVAEATNSLVSRVTISSANATNAYVNLLGTVASNPVITQSNSLVPFSSVQGFPSDPQQFKVGGINLLTNVLVAPPTGYQVSLDGSGWADSTNVPALPRDGVVTAQTNVFIRVAPTAPVGSASGNIVLSSTQASNVLIPVSRVVGANTGPQLIATPTVLPAFATDLGTASATNSFLLTGSGLSNSVALTAPSGFEISTDNGTTFVSNSTLTPRASGFISNNIAVRLAGTPSAGVFSGNVTAASVGVVPAIVSVAGTVYADASTQIAASPLSLSNFATTNGTPSPSQSFLGSARNLGTDLVATASGGYEVSTNNADFSSFVSVAPVGGNVDPVAFHARISSNALPTNSLVGTITLSSGSAATAVVTLNGEVDSARPLSVVLNTPTSNPTIIAPGSSVRLSATVSDTNASGQPVQVANFEFRTNDIVIPGAFVTNVTSPYTLTFDWTPSPAGLPTEVSAWAVDVDGWEGSSAAVTVRNPDPGEPVVGFTPPIAYPTSSQIEAVAPATNGAFYIGGSFTNLVRSNGSVAVTNAATRVARILADGTVDSEFITETGPNNTVRTLLYSATNQGLYLGGVFTNVSGVSRPGLARLAVGQTNVDDGTLDTNFAPTLGAVSSPIVNAVVQQYDGKILVGGIFTTAGTGTNSTSSANLARFLTNGVRDVSFAPPAPNGEVKSIALQPDGKILIAGSFAQVAGQARKGLARLNIDGSLDTSFTVGTGTSGGFNGTVWSVAVALDGSIYAGGQFSSYNGRSVYNNLAKLSSTGVLQAQFNYAGTLAGGINNVIRNVQMRPGGDILVSGLFTQIANSVLFPTPVAAGRVAEFVPAGTLDAAFNPGGAGANNSVLNASTLANGNLVLVGAFTQYNGQSYPRMVVLAGASATDSVITSPPFFTVDAGTSFDFPFTSSGAAPYANSGALLPRGVFFDSAGKLSGIPLDAGEFDMDVSSTIPGVGFGNASTFRLQVLPKIVPYDTWKKVWFTTNDQTNATVSGPLISRGNPSGQPNFTVYALSGGDPREDGPWILPEAAPTYFEGQQYLGYTVWRYPLADAVLSVQTSGDLQTWGTNTVIITNTTDFFQVRPTVPMSLTNQQFLRLKISAP